MKWYLSAIALIATVSLSQAAPLELKKGDHVCYLGNTLADRMQHHGWLETYIQHRFPKHELVFRNLGFSGDELTVRLRSANFGSPEQWLTHTKADVIFAFFGYNESFGGEEGLAKFAADLDNFVKQTVGQKFNGKSAPRLVLFSPVAHEDLKDPNLPDGKANNVRLKMYTEAMAKVAAAQGVPFVDLFTMTQALYAGANKPLTINGIHMNEHGDQLLGAAIDQALFGPAPAGRSEAALQKLRSAVLDKDFYWFNRYRTVDGYSIYGGRADLRFVNGQTNRVVMQREMAILDQMTANRDPRIWAVAQGGDLKVDDGNTDAFIPVITNKPGAGPNGTHLFLGGEEAIGKMTIAKGMRVNLFASEEMFPEMVNPVQMSFDPQGRLWVAVWPTYPHWKPKGPMNDKLLILEDTNGDGKADKCSTFVDDLHCPTGFEFYNGGVLVAQAPDLVFLKDTDGDGKADYRERVINGLDSADTHHTSNSFALDPGGALYFQEGTFHHTQVETPYGPPERCANAGVFRYEPRAQKFGVYISFGFANPHGHVFDHWGQDIVVDGTGAVPYHAALFSGHVDFPTKHRRPPTVYQQRTRPCPGLEILSSRHFPDEMQGHLLVPNVIGFQGILRYRLEDRGASFAGIEAEPILSSSDPSFRPTDLKIGPDGAIYFVDWMNPIIGHMQHNLRDPSRDTMHGRVYRVTYEGRPLLKPVAIAGQPLDKLLDVLKQPEDRVRYRARIELGGRKTDEVMPAVTKWLATLDPKDPNYEHQCLEALWLHQSHNVVNLPLLEQMLSAQDFRARAAATRVLCYWHDRVPGALERLTRLATDPHPRVRLEAVRAASFFAVPEAIEVALLTADNPKDPYIDFTREETLRTLEPYWKDALAKGRKIRFATDTGMEFLLRNAPLDQVLKMERTPVVARELLFRAGLPDETRREALATLARLEKKSELRVLLDAIARIDTGKEERDERVTLDLARLLTGRAPADLRAVRGEIEKLATAARQPVVRQLGFVMMMTMDGKTDAAWALGSKSAANLYDLVSAVPLLSDASLKAALYARVEPLLQGLPASLKGPKGRAGGMGRYVRVELPGKARTLTLAEVEVMSDGRNVALQGKATQKNTASGGVAKRGIDGNKNPSYNAGGQTHTREGTEDPWWEVDLGQEFPIDAIIIYNRNDGNLGTRLRGYTLRVLDARRNEVFAKKDNPTPEPKAEFELGGGIETLVRRAAMNALTSVRGEEVKTFEKLAQIVRSPEDRVAAVRALQRIPKGLWPKEEAAPLLGVVVEAVRKIPTAERTSPDALDLLSFADGLASLLPAPDARKARAELEELGVRVIRIATLPERMAYDKEVIVVKAGKPVEFLFENTDFMPHNLVITQPGALEEIGLAAEASATDASAAERQFVPRSNKILLSSRLLQPRDSQRLTFVAPSQPGVYPYVCTYPGHWRRMYGALYVVSNLEDYQADPENYLASNPLPIKDAMLKDRRPRTEWKYEDLAAAVVELQGRSLGNARHMFEVASCVACHKLEGKGNVFGPDLTQLDPKLTPADILREMLDPSAKINEKFQTYVIETKAGKTITGLILEETPETVKIIENPLAKAEPLVLKKADIEARAKSNVSIMPKGLLDKLTRDEILDLLAYIAARGNANHELFRGGAHGGHQHGH